MVRNMINPFQYGGVVSQESFCDREKELLDLLRAMENRERLFVYSERRVGKTSLVRRALGKLPKKKFIGAYVDLWPTDDEGSFTMATAKAITESMENTADKMLQFARKFFGRLSPSVTAGPDGEPHIAFTLNRLESPGPEMDEVLETPARIAEKRHKTVVLVFDEFQRILEYDSDLAERKLRSIIQTQQQVSYIFLGSRKHLIQKMYLDQSRPLYRAGGHYPLGLIPLQAWVPFIRKRFHHSDKKIDDQVIHSICEMTGGHPFYTQHLCHAVWELCEHGCQISRELVDNAVRLLLDRETYAYTSLWESLSINQRRFLIGLANEPENVKVFGADFLRRYKIRSSSTAQRVVKALLERDIIDRFNGSFLIGDRFFKVWINHMLYNPT
jgi:hypothetical protein